MQSGTDSTYDFKPLRGYEHFEATTQIIISEILNRGLPFEVIDEKNNLIAVYHHQKEYIIHEGTISDANSLIAFWISNDKWMTKQFLDRHQISHAKGRLIHKNDSASLIQNFKTFPAVVKPTDTDHGIAVSTNIQSQADLKEAVDQAFQHSDKIIVEEYHSGREFRFLVIDFEVRAVAFREPANVIGDGQNTIASLIEAKNQNRGEDYTHPLLKIKTDHEAERHLKNMGRTLSSIPPKNEKVFLRSNSNLSTGGDSIDVTDEMPDFYKDVAKKSAKAAGLRIAGIDIIIKDTQKKPDPENYIVVELNAPAMLSMHDFPYKGQNRQVEKYVLDCILNSK